MSFDLNLSLTAQQQIALYWALGFVAGAIFGLMWAFIWMGRQTKRFREVVERIDAEAHPATRILWGLEFPIGQPIQCSDCAYIYPEPVTDESIAAHIYAVHPETIKIQTDL